MKFLKTSFGIAILGAISLSASLAVDRDSAKPTRPNFVFVLADDLGYGDLPCYGNRILRTPNLDRFATEGMRFTDFYAPSAVCSPSRAGFLTGRSPLRCGVITAIQEGRDMHLRSSETTIATVLRQAGYDTCHVGKWHLNGRFNSPDQPQPGDHGFNYWMATQNNALPSHKDPTTFVRNGKPLGKLEGYSGLLVAHEAAEWLASGRDKSKPFFLNVWLNEPHLPIANDPEFEAPYQDMDPMKQKYFGSVTQMDAAFGMILEALKKQGLAENTVVFFSSDNGPESLPFGPQNHGSTGGLRGAKRETFEGGLRVPFLVRWPGHIAADSVNGTPAVGMDLFPTLCALADVPPPSEKKYDGESLVPVLAGGAPAPQRPIFLLSAPEPGGFPYAMRDGDWKIRASRDFRRLELYNLKNDPHECVNRAEFKLEQRKALLATLKKSVVEMLAEHPAWADRDTDWDAQDPENQPH